MDARSNNGWRMMIDAIRAGRAERSSHAYGSGCSIINLIKR